MDYIKYEKMADGYADALAEHESRLAAIQEQVDNWPVLLYEAPILSLDVMKRDEDAHEMF